MHSKSKMPTMQHISHLRVVGKNKGQNKSGRAGHRSPYLSHAKGALYHLSYTPVDVNCSQVVTIYSSNWSSCHNLILHTGHHCPPARHLLPPMKRFWSKVPHAHDELFIRTISTPASILIYPLRCLRRVKAAGWVERCSSGRSPLHGARDTLLFYISGQHRQAVGISIEEMLHSTRHPERHRREVLCFKRDGLLDRWILGFLQPGGAARVLWGSAHHRGSAPT